MVKTTEQRTSVSISKKTKNLLDSIKHPGQSYNGLMQELVVLWEKKKTNGTPPKQ